MTTKTKGTTGTTGRERQAKTKCGQAGAFCLLLVEGDPNLRRRLKRMLLKTAPNISVIEANSVTTAIRRFDDNRPGTILLALALPDGDGLEVLRHAMAMDPHCMVIVLTDHATDASRLKCFEEGADFVFAKSTAVDRAVAIAQRASQRELARAPRTPQPKRIQQARLRLKNKSGLHVVPAAQLVRLAQRFRAQIEVACNEHTADAKSLMDVLALGAEYNMEITVTAEGRDALEGLTAIRSLVARGFHEKRAPAKV